MNSRPFNRLLTRLVRQQQDPPPGWKIQTNGKYWRFLTTYLCTSDFLYYSRRAAVREAWIFYRDNKEWRDA